MNHMFPKALKSEQSIHALRQRLEAFERRSIEQLTSISDSDGKICDLHVLLGEAEKERRGQLFVLEQMEREQSDLRGVVQEALAHAEALKDRVALVEQEQSHLDFLGVLALKANEEQHESLRRAQVEFRVTSEELIDSQAVAQELTGELDESNRFLRAQHAELRATCWDESLRQEEVERASKEERLMNGEAVDVGRDLEVFQSSSDSLIQVTSELRERLALLQRGVTECPGMAEDVTHAGHETKELQARLLQAEDHAGKLRGTLEEWTAHERSLRARLDEARRREGELVGQLGSARQEADDLSSRRDELERSSNQPVRARLEQAELRSEEQARRLHAELGEAEQEDRALRGSVSEHEQEAQKLRGLLEKQEAQNEATGERLSNLQAETQARERRKSELEQEIAEQRKKGCSVC